MIQSCGGFRLGRAVRGYRSVWQTETNNPTMSGGDLFVNPAGGIGISSQYQGNVTADAWHRVAFTFDLTKRQLGKYIDGANVLTGPVGSAPLGTGPYQYLSASGGIVDQRWSLDNSAILFGDEDGELGAAFLNSLQFRATVLSPAQIASLGGPSASGMLTFHRLRGSASPPANLATSPSPGRPITPATFCNAAPRSARQPIGPRFPMWLTTRWLFPLSNTARSIAYENSPQLRLVGSWRADLRDSFGWIALSGRIASRGLAFRGRCPRL